MKLAPVIAELDRLEFRQTGGVLDWAGLRKMPGALPAAFVLPAGETASGNSLDTGRDQKVEVELVVAIVVAAGTRREGAAVDLLDDLAAATIARLTGWTHPEASRPTSYRGAEPMFADENVVAWAIRFATAYHRRSPR